MKILPFIITLLSAGTALAQVPGVNPIGASDRDVDQVLGKVNVMTETTVAVDYSRHTIEPSGFIWKVETTWDESGMIQSSRSFDEDGLKLSGTLYQYKDGVKNVTTSFDSGGTRTLQTLYSFTNDGVCARMRVTDAIGVTISTAEVSHKERWSAIAEKYDDGEVVTTEYFYDANTRLIKRTISSSEQHSVLSITLNAEGFAAKSVLKDKHGKTTFEYDYEYDNHGNWTRRVTKTNGIPTQIATRDYVYF